MYWDIVVPLTNSLESFYQTLEAPPACHRAKLKPRRTYVSSVKSEINLNNFSRMSTPPHGSLMKDFIVKSAHDVTIGPRSIMTLRPMFAESNLLGSFIDVRYSWPLCERVVPTNCVA